MKYSEFIPYKIPFEDVDLDAYQDICHSYKVLARMKNIENTRIMVFDYISRGLSFYRDKDKAFIQQSDEAFHYIYHKEDLEQPGIKRAIIYLLARHSVIPPYILTLKPSST